MNRRLRSAIFRLSKKSVYRKQIGIKKRRNELPFLQTENKMYVKRHGSHRENRGVACFCREMIRNGILKSL